MANDDATLVDEWKFVSKKMKAKNNQNLNSTKVKQYPTNNNINPNKRVLSIQLTDSDPSFNSINGNDEESKLTDVTIFKLHELVNIFKTHHLNEVLECKIKQQEKYISSIVGLGIGNFSTSHLALVQFAIMLSLSSYVITDVSLNNNAANSDDVVSSNNSSKTINGDKVNGQSVCMYTYDPVFTAVEIEICRRLNIRLLNNCQGKYSITDLSQYCAEGDIIVNNSPTTASLFVTTNSSSSTTSSTSETITIKQGVALFYMPHCPYRLYCNVLWRNWFDLDRMIIVGNSFTSYGLRRLHMTRTKSSGNKSKSHKHHNNRSNNSNNNSHIDENKDDDIDTTDFVSRLKMYTRNTTASGGVNTTDVNDNGKVISSSIEISDGDIDNNRTEDVKQLLTVGKITCCCNSYTLSEDSNVWPSQLLKKIANTTVRSGSNKQYVSYNNHGNNDDNINNNNNNNNNNTDSNINTIANLTIANALSHCQQLQMAYSKEISESITIALTHLENACTDISCHSFSLVTDSLPVSGHQYHDGNNNINGNNNNNNNNQMNSQLSYSEKCSCHFCESLPTEDEMNIASLADYEVW